MPQDLPDSFDILRSLTAHFSRVMPPDTQLRPFLTDFVNAAHQHWSDLAQFSIYVRQPDQTYTRQAGIGLSPDAEPEPVNESLVAQVTTTRVPILPDPDAGVARWIVPLISANDLIGILDVKFRLEHPVPPMFEPTLLALAAPLALTIGQLSDESTRNQRPTLLGLLSNISRQVGASLTHADVLNTICQRLAAALSLDYTAILRFDVPSATATVAAEHPLRLGQADALPLEDFGVYQHLQTYQSPVVIEDVQTDSTLLGPNQARFQALHFHSIVMAPLLVQGDLIGSLMLAASDRTRTLSQDDVHSAQIAATQVALSLRTAEFFVEIQQRANQLERIAAFGRVVTGTLDRDQILQHVMEVTPNLLRADRVCVAFYTLDQNRMQLFESGDGITPHETTVAAAGSGVEEVVQQHNSLLIADLASSTYTDHPRLLQQGLQAAIVAPLMVSGRTFGAVMVGHQRARIYTPTDLTLLQQIGNQIAIALENANLFNAAQQRATYEEALSEITSHLQEQSDLRMILQQTMQNFGAVLGASRARVRLQVTAAEFDISKLFQPKE